MLVLKRKPNETIVLYFLGLKILTIQVMDTRPGHVRLGFDGLPSLKILRGETELKARAA